MVDLGDWYIRNKSTYESLLVTVKGIIESLLERQRVRYWHVQARVKEYDEFLAKQFRKKYAQPEDMIDFAALRVILYLKKDKGIVTGLLEDNFEVIKKEDKSIGLGTNKLGYNAVHLDSMLKNDRSKLPELVKYKGLKFEIQVTTVLQHTYSEISHNLIYKGGDALPGEIQRSIELTSGVLEGLDDNYDRIMNDIDNHEEDTNKSIEKDKLDIPVDSPSLRLYLTRMFGDIPDFKPQFGSVNENDVIDQLHAMGINTIAELQDIIPENFKERYREIPESGYGTYRTGLIVWFLIILDPERFFTKAYKKSYGIFDSHDFEVLKHFKVDTSKLPLNLFECD